MRPRLLQRLRSRRAPNKRNPSYSRLGASALAHSALAFTLPLLIVVMMIPPYREHHGMVVELARVFHATSMPGALREDTIRIALTKDGSIYFRNVRLTASDLPQQIRDCVKNGAEPKAYLNVDSRTRYVDVETVLDEVRHAGIGAIALLAEKRPWAR